MEQKTPDEQIIMLPFIIPLPMYKLMHEAALKEGKTVEHLVSEAIREKVEKLGGKTSPY